MSEMASVCLDPAYTVDILHRPCNICWSGSEWPPEQLKGKAMGTVDILSLIKLGNLSDAQKAHLKDKLTERKRDLEAAMKRVEQGLALLKKKSKAKKSAKRRKSAAKR
jgi:hypothetical protein